MVVGCRGYVVLVAEAIWFWLRRLCVGELKNKANLSPARASLLGLSFAIISYMVKNMMQHASKQRRNNETKITYQSKSNYSRTFGNP